MNPALDAESTLVSVLQSAPMELVWRITGASNVALLAKLTVAQGAELPGVAEPEASLHVIYKPIRGERPLWDFPDGTLAGREVASFQLARHLGVGIIPATVLREGPLGPGSVQVWIGDPFASADLPSPVRLVARGKVPPGHLPVVDGQLADGRWVSVVHEDRDDVRDAALLDAVLNNSDRKGSHLVRDASGRLWGFDHGLTLHADPKLRTVLWGWAGDPLRPRDVDRLSALAADLERRDSAVTLALASLLPAGDLSALRDRVAGLLADGKYPQPSGEWPAIPWPAL